MAHTTNYSTSQNPTKDENLRRVGLMQQIVTGARLCVLEEYECLYRLIRKHCPENKYTINKNGVFVPLKTIPLNVLEQCNELIQHGKAQMKKEKTRQHRENQLYKSFCN